jgi:hypothetical protein
MIAPAPGNGVSVDHEFAPGSNLYIVFSVRPELNEYPPAM